jgi:hypothetical protein
MLELEKMTQSVKQPSRQHLSDQRAFIETLIKWIALEPTGFRSVNYPLFREMIQRASPDFSVPVYTLTLHTKRLADIYRQLPGH